jgi:hypothetical protein
MTSDSPDDDPNYAAIDGVDPYIDWVLGAGRPYYFLPERKTDWMPVLIRLDDIDVRAFAEGSFLTRKTDAVRWVDVVKVFPVHHDLPQGEEAQTYCAALLRVEHGKRGGRSRKGAGGSPRLPFFDILLKDDGRGLRFVGSVSLSLPVDEEVLPDFSKEKRP